MLNVERRASLSTITGSFLLRVYAKMRINTMGHDSRLHMSTHEGVPRQCRHRVRSVARLAKERRKTRQKNMVMKLFGR